MGRTSKTLSGSSEMHFQPKAPEWEGPHFRVLGCSDGTEETMRPPNPLFMHATVEQGMWIYTLDGYVELEDGDRITRIGPGTVLAYRSPSRGTIIYRKQGMPWRRIYIGITGGGTLPVFDYLLHRFGPIHSLPDDCEAVNAARNFCRLAAAGDERPAQFWSVEAFKWLNAWWSSCEDCIPSGERLVDLDVSSSQLVSLSHGSVKELAQRLGYSPSYLSRRLKKIWRKNPSEVLREQQLEEATRLLRDTTLPVSEVARRSDCDEIRLRQQLRVLRRVPDSFLENTDAIPTRACPGAVGVRAARCRAVETERWTRSPDVDRYVSGDQTKSPAPRGRDAGLSGMARQVSGGGLRAATATNQQGTEAEAE